MRTTLNVAILLVSFYAVQASVLNGARVGASVAALRAAVLPIGSVQALRGGHHDDKSEGNLERSLAIIKPDAVAAGNEQNIKKAITDQGFKIVAEMKTQLSKKQAQNFYKEHKGKPFYDGLVEFMTSGPVVVMTLQRRNAIKGWRELMGPTNSLKARAEAKNSIRALYGTDGGRNACHGSDSPKSAAREIRFFFGIIAWLKVVLPGYKHLFWPH